MEKKDLEKLFNNPHISEGANVSEHIYCKYVKQSKHEHWLVISRVITGIFIIRNETYE